MIPCPAGVSSKSTPVGRNGVKSTVRRGWADASAVRARCPCLGCPASKFPQRGYLVFACSAEMARKVKGWQEENPPSSPAALSNSMGGTRLIESVVLQPPDPTGTIT
jgi:hypothetical protein